MPESLCLSFQSDRQFKLLFFTCRKIITLLFFKAAVLHLSDLPEQEAGTASTESANTPFPSVSMALCL